MISLRVYKSLQGPHGELPLDIELRVAHGQFATLYGPSGAGKTTTLRLLAGLLKPDKGRIEVNGETWFDVERNIHLKPQQRRVGYVFQDYALFPHMTVRQNLEFALQKGQSKKAVDDLVELTELGDLQGRKPETLSGGQKQRVALARALVPQPDILLLDEPLSALDRTIRLKLQDYLQTVHREMQLTTLLVSHDLGEIHKLADWVFELENGKITRQGTPTDLFVKGQVSGKFRFTGEVLKLEPQDVVVVVTVLVQNQVVQVVAQPSEVENLQVGDTVVVASKAFNPVIWRVD